MLNAPKIEDMKEGMRFVKTGSYAFLTDEPAVNFEVNSDCETFTIADERFYYSSVGFILPQNSPYRNSFNKA